MTKPITKTVYVAVPSYDGKILLDTMDRLYRCPKKQDFRMLVGTLAGSLLADTFNQLLCVALNGHARGEIDYFAMLHADVIPEPYWLDKLYNLIRERDADIVSCVIPLKDNQGLTSTAIAGDNPWLPQRRLTMTEICQLPKTFNNAMAGHPDWALLVNTGCFIMDLSKPSLKGFSFDVRSNIECVNGEFKTFTMSEDWAMSAYCHMLGGEVYATREVEIYHAGNMYYGNQTPWGTCKTDPKALALAA